MDDNTQPGTRVEGAFGRGTLSPDGNVLTLDSTQPGTAPKVTPADIEAEIASEHYFTAAEGVAGEASLRHRVVVVGDQQPPEPLKLLTFCVLVLRNGFTVTGESACASPENFDAEVGRKVARAAAVAQMWKLLGFRLRDHLASAHPVLDASKLRQTENTLRSIMRQPAASAEVEIEFNVIDNPNDLGYLVVAKGCRGDLVRVEREQVKQARPSHTEDDRRRFITEAKQRAAARVQEWFDTHQDDDRQQDA